MTRIVLEGVDPEMVKLANLNKRIHWAQRDQATKYWRGLTWATSAKWPTPRLERAHVTVTIRWPDNQRRDPANWAPLAKACVDGLTDACWWPDDNSRHVIGPDLRRDPDNGPHRVVIDIEAVS